MSNLKPKIKKQRKRFLGSMDVTTKGEDPRKNLEERLEVEIICLVAHDVGSRGGPSIVQNLVEYYRWCLDGTHGN
jgi:hypothetical protein